MLLPCSVALHYVQIQATCLLSAVLVFSVVLQGRHFVGVDSRVHFHHSIVLSVCFE